VQKHRDQTMATVYSTYRISISIQDCIRAWRHYQHFSKE